MQIIKKISNLDLPDIPAFYVDNQNKGNPNNITSVSAKNSVVEESVPLEQIETDTNPTNSYVYDTQKYSNDLNESTNANTDYGSTNVTSSLRDSSYNYADIAEINSNAKIYEGPAIWGLSENTGSFLINDINETNQNYKMTNSMVDFV